MRSRGWVGNCRCGADLFESDVAAEVRLAGHTDAQTAVVTDCARKCLRVNMGGSLAEWHVGCAVPKTPPYRKERDKDGAPISFGY